MVFVLVRQTDTEQTKQKTYTGLFLHSGIGLSQEGLMQLLVHIILWNQCICGRHWINNKLQNEKKDSLIIRRL